MSQEAAAFYNQGYAYYTGTGGYPLNYGRAWEYFEKAAELGVSDAMNYLGCMCENGHAVAQDIRRAAEWYYKALQANVQNPYAAYNMGRMYYSGTGVGKDVTKAYQLFKTSVDLGRGNTHSVYGSSCWYVGCILFEQYNDKKGSYPYFVDAAKYGNIPAAWYNLGWLAENGVLPLKDPGNNPKAARDSMARDFYEEAANRGSAEAMDALGRIYFAYGQRETAKQWLEKAAAMGNAAAKKRLKMINMSSSGSLLDLFR